MSVTDLEKASRLLPTTAKASGETGDAVGEKEVVIDGGAAERL